MTDREVPWIVGASSCASAGAAACAIVPPRRAKRARRLAIAGVLAEGALMQALEHRRGHLEGDAGRLAKAAKSMSTAGAALIATKGRKSRAAATIGGALVCAGEMCLRRSLLRERLRRL